MILFSNYKSQLNSNFSYCFHFLQYFFHFSNFLINAFYLFFKLTLLWAMYVCLSHCISVCLWSILRMVCAIFHIYVCNIPQISLWNITTNICGMFYGIVQWICLWNIPHVCICPWHPLTDVGGICHTFYMYRKIHICRSVNG